ncbi:hypothetical protein [Streptomyces sp. NBC_01013]|uniref:hypothetical protein n=1 Tax=Streptomyces sp. NBC_01013 TaxID=2903718 RepID=UPI00386C77CB|nr:hypothetical protein OG538_21530 [Streptomyces sp. NBC_01013]
MGAVGSWPVIRLLLVVRVADCGAVHGERTRPTAGVRRQALEASRLPRIAGRPLEPTPDTKRQAPAEPFTLYDAPSPTLGPVTVARRTCAPHGLRAG